jgi:TonB family protein
MHSSRRLSSPVLLALWLAVCAPAPAMAQDVLSRAKDLYASAAYEEALQLLSSVREQPVSSEASAYQVFCLVALGRRDEARAAVESIVRADPLFRPSEDQVSPRIRAFFDEIRKPLLSDAARAAYAKGKAAFDRKDWVPALAEFDRTLAVLAEVDETDTGAADLKTLATGFRDLARTASQPPPPPPQPAAPAAAPPPAPVVYGEGQVGVIRPVLLSKQLPEWRPNAVEAKMTFSGEVELVVGEDGRVLSVTVVRSIHPRYDATLIEAAKAWTFKPATLDGVPVRYRYMLDVRLGK